MNNIYHVITKELGRRALDVRGMRKEKKPRILS